MKKCFVLFVLLFLAFSGIQSCQNPCEVLSTQCDFCKDGADADTCKLTSAINNGSSCSAVIEDFNSRSVCIISTNNNTNTNGNTNTNTNTNNVNNTNNTNTNVNNTNTNAPNNNVNNINNTANTNNTNTNNTNTNNTANTNNTNTNNTNTNTNTSEVELDKEACRLLVEGPFEERSVSATTIDAPILSPDTPKVYRVRFPKTGNGFIRFSFEKDVTLLLYSKPFVVMEMLSTGGQTITPDKEEIFIEACTDVKRKLTYVFTAGSYYFKIGPSAATDEVALVVKTK